MSISGEITFKDQHTYGVPHGKTRHSLALKKTCCLLAGWLVLACTVGRNDLREGSTQATEVEHPPFDYFRVLGDVHPGDGAVRGQISKSSGTSIWSFLGPEPITVENCFSGTPRGPYSGAVSAIAVHPGNPQSAYIASASGGVWKTVDGGSVWTPLTDHLPSLKHGCLAIDPIDQETIYAGTGRCNFARGGAGVFKTTDGGLNWQGVATEAQVGNYCCQLAVDPLDTSRLHLAGAAGYVRSTDGGLSWSPPFLTRSSSVAIASPKVYAAFWNEGIYRSVDNGVTFDEIMEGIDCLGVGRIALALAPSDQDVVYAAVIESSDLCGFYQSVDGGDTWQKKDATPNFPGGQGNYDLTVVVDPNDPQVVYAGGVTPWKSVDGGDSWSSIAASTIGGPLHVDHHAFTFGPDGTLWNGNDGGVWKSPDGGETWFSLNDTLAITETYQIALHPTDPGQVMGGTQDNGTSTRWTGQQDWARIWGGDGGFLSYDGQNPNRVYVSVQNLNVRRLDTQACEFEGINGPWHDLGEPVAFIAPVIMAPSDSRTLLAASNRVWRTTNADTSAQWDPLMAPSTSPFPLQALAVAPSDSDTIYAAGYPGRVLVTTDDGVIWLDASLTTGGTVNDIVIHPNSPGTVYVSAYTSSASGKVLRTLDHGNSWTDVTGNLPSELSARALAVDWGQAPPVLYLGTGAGLWSSSSEGEFWVDSGHGLPNVAIGDLRIDIAARSLTAGTYGRGTWRATLQDLQDDLVFADGFESGDVSAWSSSSGSCQNIAPGNMENGFVSNGAEDDADGWGEWPLDVTDGDLSYSPASTHIEDGVIGFFNADEDQELVIQFDFDFGDDYEITIIRYNMGNVQRADTWGADYVVTPLGTSAVNPGTPFMGAWTYQAGSILASSLTIEVRKTRTSAVSDWLFVGEIQICGRLAP